MHSIILNNVRIFGHHGVLPQEQVVGAYFTIDLRIETDFTHALETDELEGTISYADIYELLKQEMAINSKLLEHVGGRIVKALFSKYPNIYKITLRILKENPPMGAEIGEVGIEITETKQ